MRIGIRDCIDSFAVWGSCFALKLDVTDAEEVQAAIQEGLKYFGGIDILVHKAGFANVASIEDMDIHDFQNQVAPNFFGVVYMTKAVLQILRKQKKGSINNINLPSMVLRRYWRENFHPLGLKSLPLSPMVLLRIGQAQCPSYKRSVLSTIVTHLRNMTVPLLKSERVF